MGDICELRGLIVDNIINPALWLIFAVGLLVFVFGVVEFVYGLNAETEARNRGKQHMFWGLVGMFIMFVSLSIVYIIMGAVGATPEACTCPNGLPPGPNGLCSSA
jgi:uncharacterized membrane protein YecN with MAPEG domain